MRALVFAHRGSAALLPEETLAAFERAIADGADYIEPDLVPTRDGVLVARHESNIIETTNVADHPEFASRRLTKVIDGKIQEGWFTEDFTLRELKTLRAKERLGALRPQSQRHDGRFEIATLDEIVALAARSTTTRGNPVGLIPEIKHSSYFAALGFDMEALLMSALAPFQGPLIVQSFEISNLKRLHKALPHVALMQLIETPNVPQPADVVNAGGTLFYEDMLTPAGLADIASYAQWVCVHTGRLTSAVLSNAHRVGLRVSVFTFRPENQFLPCHLRHGAPGTRWPQGMVADVTAFLCAQIDGFFTDDALLGRLAVDAMEAVDARCHVLEKNQPLRET